MQLKKSLDPSYQYFLDNDGRIRPIHQMGWSKEPWRDAATFDDAIAAISTSAHTCDIFPPQDWVRIPLEEWRDLEAKRYLDVEDAFYLATGVDVRYALFRFQWGTEIFFNIRPDFGFLSLTTDLGELPINAVESAIRDGLIDYYRETEALKRAIDAAEIDPLKVYSIEWWQDFWKARGVVTATANEFDSEGLHAAAQPEGSTGYSHSIDFWKKWVGVPLDLAVTLVLGDDPEVFNGFDQPKWKLLKALALNHAISGDTKFKAPNNSDTWSADPVVLLPEFGAWAESLGYELRDEFPRGRDKATAQPLSPKAETTYLNIIAALLECISGDAPGVGKHPSFSNQSALITFLDDKYKGISGLSKRNLEKYFAEAKRNLTAST